MHIIQEPVKVNKLTIPYNLPELKNGYNLYESPEFWKPIFDDMGDNLIDLRQKIKVLLDSDSYENVEKRVMRNENVFNTCGIVEKMFPAYFTKANPDFGSYPTTFVETNTILCTLLILLGIISNKLVGQDYNYIFKGGKAVQFVLSEIKNSSRYFSDDIDILVIQRDGIQYNKDNMENFSEHISLLLKWFLSYRFPISIDFPNTNERTENKELVKFSYMYYDYNEKTGKSKKNYKALSDIAFNEIKGYVVPFFMNPKNFRLHISELNEDVLFRCPDMYAIINEKIYYYLKFIELKELLSNNIKINDTEYEFMTIEELTYLMQKFKRSIKALLGGLIKLEINNGFAVRNDVEYERNYLRNYLQQFDKSNAIKESVVKSITEGNPYDV